MPPVYLVNPFSRIVNVGWPRGFDYIAFAMQFKIERDDDLESGIGLPTLPADSLNYWPTFLVSSQYAHRTPSAPISAVAAMLGGGLWTPLEADQVSFSGVPDPAAGSFSYGSFQKLGGGGSRSNEGITFKMSGPDIRIQEGGGVGGSEIDVDPPSGSFRYKDGSTFTLEHRGDVFTGGPEFKFPIGTFQAAWAPCTGVFDPAPILGNASRYSAHAFNYAGVAASLGGANYVFAGLAAREQTAIGAGTNSTINVNVLLSKVV